MRRKWKKPKKKIVKKFVSNEQIKAPRVFVIGANGDKLGEMDTRQALQIARSEELDLIEVNPKAEIPVVRITDLGKLKYETEKKAHRQQMQQKKVDVKVVRLSVRIGKHDFDMKMEQARKFLNKGNKLKIELILKGRERQYPIKGREVIASFVDELKASMDLQEDQILTKQGARYIITLVNKNS